MIKYIKPKKEGGLDISAVLKQFHNIDVRTIMKSKMWDMCFVTPDTPVEEIIGLLGSRKHIWVVSSMKSMRLKGLITERDLVEVIAPRKIDPYQFSISGFHFRSMLFGGVETAEDMMTSDLITISPEKDLGTALTKMKKHHLKRLPVVVKGKLVGELTMKSVIIQFKKVLKWTMIMSEQEREASGK
ncbi:MAG: CBS domain-containing protein [Thermoplasmata archaeon]|nr:MAG: cobalt transporter [Thermoplasmatales archaeon ex4484_6]RLF55717.1 MAG: CBS domain-containing protein [Thermoplasmata archaeon]RLF65897.1 MAG: CBS domain-containing protein [Thermoplasmata archaeon]